MQEAVKVESLASEFGYDIPDLSLALSIIIERGVTQAHALIVLETMLRAAHAAKLKLKASELASFTAQLVHEAEVISSLPGR